MVSVKHNCMRIASLYFLLILCSCKNNKKSKFITGSDTRWEVSNIHNNVLYFSNGASLRTNLYDMEYVGQLKSLREKPYIIISGRTCLECDENISIYLLYPGASYIPDSMMLKYSYPGIVTDYENGDTVFASKMFYGNCLKNKNDCVVFLQKTYDHNKCVEQNTFVVQVIKDTLAEAIFKNTNLNFNDRTYYQQTDGINTTSEP